MPNEIQSYNHTRKNIRIPKFELVFTPMVLHVVKHWILSFINRSKNLKNTDNLIKLLSKKN